MAVLLYGLDLSHYVVKVKKILDYKGIAFEYEYAPYNDRQDLLRVSGQDYVPFLLWDAHDVTAAYSRQSARVITPESLWYLPLRVVGLAHVKSHISFGAGAPHWANVAAQALQATVVVVLILVATRVAPREIHASQAKSSTAPTGYSACG